MPQDQLLRCVGGGAEGHPEPCVSRTAPGRGGWLCSLECFDIAVKRRGFERAWKRPVGADALRTLRIAFERVITNMKEVPIDGHRAVETVPTKG